MSLSVILPAHNEAQFLPACLAALRASDIEGLEAQLIVVANGCSDETAAIARQARAELAENGWHVEVIEREEGGKLGALQAGDDAARSATRVYLDADVTVSPGLLRALAAALEGDAPKYASGTPCLAPARSRVSRAYGRFWQTLPFAAEGVPGFGLFAVNRAGRARWSEWPDIISDDTFARLSFAPEERIRVAERYSWPLVEGFSNLVRVRRRQNEGVREVHDRYPALAAHDVATAPGFGRILRLALAEPVGFLVYAAVALAVKTPLFKPGTRWARGR